MSTYAVGDVQGCFASFLALLERIEFEPQKDRLWLVGDVVNRGAHSLAMLRWVKENQDICQMVLGNHDLALIAMSLGLRAQKPLDTLDAILAAPDSAELIDWLRRQPLVVEGSRHVMLHAGVLPHWSENDVIRSAKKLSGLLQDDGQIGPLITQALDKHRPPQDTNDGFDAPYVLRVLTNLRALDRQGRPDFRFKGALKDLTAEQTPWFAHLNSTLWTRQLVVGHWAALGVHQTPHVFALDSGCVWGGELSALRLEDGQVFVQPTQEAVVLTPDGDG